MSRYRLWMALLSFVALATGCYASHARPVDAGSDTPTPDPAVSRCHPLDFAGCCTPPTRGCVWVPTHGGCFHVSERCMEGGECAGDLSCRTVVEFNTVSHCTGDVEFAEHRISYCVPE
jgi:hypothetical protein